MVKAFEIYAYSDESHAIEIVATEAEAIAYTDLHKGTDYLPVIRSACYCDSAYHALGHR